MISRIVDLIKYPKRCWEVAEVIVKDFGVELKTYNVNLFYEVDNKFIYIYETVGGSGYGYSKGNLKNKISIEDAEFNTIINHE